MNVFLNRMFFKRCAQAEVISVLLIVAISVAAVSVAYLWGVPIIQKGQSTNQIQEAEALMNEINRAILEVLQNGGRKSLVLDLKGNLEISENDNSIKYSLISKKAGVARTEWVPLNEDETFGINGTSQNQSIPVYGIDKDGVIMAKASVFGDEYVVDYRLVYREVDDFNTQEGRVAILSAVGNNRASSGSITLTISREPPAVSTSLSKLGGKLTSTKILLVLS